MSNEELMKQIAALKQELKDMQTVYEKTALVVHIEHLK
jgi:hypothetical protein